MSFASTFSSITLSLDFDLMNKVNKLVGTKPTKDSVLLAKDKYTIIEAIVPQYRERKLQKLLMNLEGGTPLYASRRIFPSFEGIKILREFIPE
jgi:hypothetical protein